MAATARQPKSNRKGVPDPAARRTSAWGGNRASPTFSPGPGPNRNLHSSSPGPQQPLAAGAGAGTPGAPNGSAAGAPAPSAVLQQLAGLTGTTVTVTLKAGPRWEGVVASTAAEGDTAGLTLKDARDVGAAGAPLKDRYFIPATNIAQWASGPADVKLVNGADTFKTDVDISKTAPRAERVLQAWADDSTGLDLSSSSSILSGGLSTNTSSTSPTATAGHGDDLTFGAGAGARGGPNNNWDQFATNEKLFGVKTGFDENVYTTKIDRNAPDFKERERKAQILANEIMSGTTNNPHIAEERNQNTTDDSGVNEEDKYGAVVRGPGAYVPPAARRAGSGPVTPAAPAQAPAPKVTVNAPDGSAAKPGTPAPAAAAPATGAAAAKPADEAFRHFVSTERERLEKKKQAMMREDKERRMAELLSFSKSFKLNKPMPDDLVNILAKDEDKQKAIRDKAAKDASSGSARSIAVPGSTPSLTASPSALPTGAAAPANPVKLDAAAAKMGGAPGASGKVGASAKPNGTAPSGEAAAAAAAAAAKKGKINMFIQSIPPFKKTPPATGTGSPAAVPAAAVAPAPEQKRAPVAQVKPIVAKIPNFRPNPAAVAFSPVASPPQAPLKGSPKPKGAEPPAAAAAAGPVGVQAGSAPAKPNEFFGTRVIKKSAVSIKEDFNPFKHAKVADASSVGAMWPYNGKRFLHMYPPIQGPPAQGMPQSSPRMQPPPVPGSVGVPQQGAGPPGAQGYNPEDPNAQAGQPSVATYVFYPPYGYPGAPMMPGMPHPGPPPPGYMPSPYMQPMHYAPPMAPNGQPMYASPPPMGQMPPPGAYMAPPPGYGQPPNGAGGPRPSMPPTPIPGHAHSYYAPSPQMQHAVPYGMMMPPPPHGPPQGPGQHQHPYDPNAAAGGPPPQMGHA